MENGKCKKEDFYSTKKDEHHLMNNMALLCYNVYLCSKPGAIKYCLDV